MRPSFKPVYRVLKYPVHFVLFLVPCLLFSASAVEAGTGMTVSPSRFRLQKPAGEAASAKVTVTNTSSTAMEVSAETTDMVTRTGDDGLSIRDEAPPGTTSFSCARWIHLSGSSRVIPPGESAEMEFVVSPPPGARAGGYGAYLFFVGRPVRAEEAQDRTKATVQMVTVPRLGVSVVYEVKGTIRRGGELLGLKLTPPSGARPMTIRHEFKNTGNAEVVLAGSFHFLDEKNLLAGKGTLRALKTFPGETGVAETTWAEELSPGLYKVMVTFELGPDAEQVIVREFPLEIAN